MSHPDFKGYSLRINKENTASSSSFKMSSILVIQREPVVHIYAAATRLSGHWKPCKDDSSVFLEIPGKMCLCGQHSFHVAAEGSK